MSSPSSSSQLQLSADSVIPKFCGPIPPVYYWLEVVGRCSCRRTFVRDGRMYSVCTICVRRLLGFPEFSTCCLRFWGELSSSIERAIDPGDTLFIFAPLGRLFLTTDCHFSFPRALHRCTDVWCGDLHSASILYLVVNGPLSANDLGTQYRVHLRVCFECSQYVLTPFAERHPLFLPDYFNQRILNSLAQLPARHVWNIPCPYPIHDSCYGYSSLLHLVPNIRNNFCAVIVGVSKMPCLPKEDYPVSLLYVDVVDPSLVGSFQNGLIPHNPAKLVL